MQVFKNILIYMLAFNVLASTLAVPLIYMDYSLRRDYISEVLCINRDKPMTTCHGKCYLDQQLESAQQSHEDDKQTVGTETPPSFYAYEFVDNIFQRGTAELDIRFAEFEQVFTLSTYLISIFKPPRG